MLGLNAHPVKATRAAILPVLCLFIIASAQAQGPGGEDKVVDDRMKTEIIDSVSHALNTTYIFPDVAAKIEKRIREQLKKKAYSEVNSLRGFSQRLTEDIRSINNDRHLWVEYLTDENLELLNSDTTGDAAAVEELRQSKKRNLGATVKLYFPIKITEKCQSWVKTKDQ